MNETGWRNACSSGSDFLPHRWGELDVEVIDLEFAGDEAGEEGVALHG